MSWKVQRVMRKLERGAEAAAAEALLHVHWVRALALLSGPIVFAILWMLAGPGRPIELTEPAARMLAIFGFTAIYWCVGALPPYSTGLVATGLMVFLVGIPSIDNPEGNVRSWTQFVDVAATPVVVLMLGGFVLGAAIHKHAIDRVLAVKLIRPFASSGRKLILGVLLVSAIFSMWTSNTATAAMMIALIAPIIAQLGRDESGRIAGAGGAVALAVAVGANVGGMATPIGTPPNAIAYGILESEGSGVSFIGWMAFGVPVAAIMLIASWAVLVLAFGVKGDANQLREINWGTGKLNWNAQRATVVSITLITICLWLTGPLTNLPVAAVALVPLVLFTATGVLDRHDINSLDWDILMLIASGLALGRGMELTGLAEAAVGAIPVEAMSPLIAVMALSTVTLVLSTFMSNTAVANMVVPIAVGLTSVLGGMGVGGLVIPIAVAASLAMALPVSTPPNAIVYARGGVNVRDFVLVGVAVGATGLITVLALTLVFQAIGM